MAKNVQVCCRFRPTNAKELEEKGAGICVEFPDEKSVKLKGHGKPFVFDHVFQPGSAQLDVFLKTAKPMVESLLSGYNVTLFAYGQTGSGKTHTMMGIPSTDQSGIIPRTVEELFKGIESADADMEFTLKLSYVEIYMEKVRDLLAPDNDNLRIRELNGDVWIEDVTELYVGSLEEVLDIMRQGETNRSIASTRMNQESSRSHSVFVLTLGQEKAGTKKSSKLFLVDLAGSEKVRKTEAEGQTLKEAQHINKSLSALGNVINALTESHKHVPYRDSKLTRLLSSSLGGNSQTCLIVTGSPSEFNCEETLSTLRFGTRAKRIKNKPTINIELSVAQYKELLDQANKKIKAQENIIKRLEKDLKTGVKSLEDGQSPTTAEEEEGETEDESKKKEKGGKSLLLTLQDQVTSLEAAKQKVADELEKVSDQLAESQRVNSAHTEQAQLVDNLKAELLKAEGKVARLNDQLGEFTLYKSKVTLMEQEYQLKIEQLKALSTASSATGTGRGSFSRSDSISDLSSSSVLSHRDVEDLLPSPMSMSLASSPVGSSPRDFSGPESISPTPTPNLPSEKGPTDPKPVERSSSSSSNESKVEKSRTSSISSTKDLPDESPTTESSEQPSTTNTPAQTPTPSESQITPTSTTSTTTTSTSTSSGPRKPKAALPALSLPPNQSTSKVVSTSSTSNTPSTTPHSSVPSTPVQTVTQPREKAQPFIGPRKPSRGNSSNQFDDAKNRESWSQREKELYDINQKLLKDLQSKCAQHLDLSVAYSELSQVNYADRQKLAWAHEQKELQNHIGALTRHNHYQKTLLKNRTDHISHLEHALHESNAAHRDQLHRHEASIETLMKELKRQQDMVEILTRERESVGQKRVGPFASPRVVIPLRGGTHTESSRSRTASAFFPSSSGQPGSARRASLTGTNGVETEVTPIRAKFASKENELSSPEDVVVTFSPAFGQQETNNDKDTKSSSQEMIKPQQLDLKSISLISTTTPERKRKASETLEFPISGLSTFDDDDDGPQPPPHLNLGHLGLPGDKNNPNDLTSPQRRSSLLQRIFPGRSPGVLKTKFTKSASGSALDIGVQPGTSGSEGTTPPSQVLSPTPKSSNQTSTTTTGAGGTGVLREPPSPQKSLSFYEKIKKNVSK